MQLWLELSALSALWCATLRFGGAANATQTLSLEGLVLVSDHKSLNPDSHVTARAHTAQACAARCPDLLCVCLCCSLEQRAPEQLQQVVEQTYTLLQQVSSWPPAVQTPCLSRAS